MIDLTDDEVGKLIEKKRKNRGWTQPQLAERAGVPTPQQISQYEHGKVSLKGQSKHLKGLAQALDLTAEELRAINPLVPMPEDTPPPNLQIALSMALAFKRWRGAVYGDMQIPPPPLGYVWEIDFDSESDDGIVLTQNGDWYGLCFAHNVPSGHSVVGAFQQLRLERLGDTPEEN